MSGTPLRPPRLARALLRAFVPSGIRGESIVGDLEQEFADLTDTRGLRAARRWYWSQTLRVAARYLAPRSGREDTSGQSSYRGRPPLPVGERALAVLQEFRYIVRKLARNPGFSIVAVFTLALGIGANTAIFSVVNGVLLRPLPYAAPERLVSVLLTAPGFDMGQIGQADATYFHFREHNTAFEDLGIYWREAVNLTGEGTPLRLGAVAVTASLFEVLGISPALGRGFTADEDKPGANPVVILSHSLWVSRFGSDPGVLGRTIQVGRNTREVVGVMPEGFVFELPVPFGTSDRREDVDLLFPARFDPSAARLMNFSYPAVGRLKAGVSLDEAHADLLRLMPQIPAAYPVEGMSAEMWQQARMAPFLVPLKHALVADAQQVLWILMGTVAFVLLIACANVANLFLVRAEGRTREIAVRTALGAERGHLVRYFLTESVVLSFAGGALGLLMAFLGVRTLVRFGPQNIPRLAEIQIDATVLLFTVTISTVAGVLFGLIPLVRSQRTSLVPALKEGGRGGTTGREQHRARHLLIVSQIAMALVLLAGSGLMARSFWNLRNVDPGFQSAGVLTMRLSLPPGAYPDQSAVARFHQQLAERLETLPGVERAAATTAMPLDGTRLPDAIYVEDVPMEPGQLPPAVLRKYVSPGYHTTMGIPLLSGRGLERSDHEQRLGNVLVNSAFARMYWPDGNPIGKRIQPGALEFESWYTIVGVVGDVRDQTLASQPEPIVYFPMVMQAGTPYQVYFPSMAIAVRTSAQPLTVTDAVRREVWALNPDIAIADVQTMDQIRAASTVQTSFILLVLGIASGVALLLGIVGVYGVITYIVSLRTQEIGVRMALGARSSDVSRMVLRQGGGVGLIGVGVGLLASLALSRLLGALLYGVGAMDLMTHGGVAVVLVAVTLVSSYLPARRAAAVDPVRALKME